MRQNLLRVLAHLIKAAESDFSLVAFDFPPRLFKKAYQDLKGFLADKGYTPEETLSDWPHISLGLIKGVSEDEKEKMKLGLPAFETKVNISGLKLLPGREDLDYLALELDFPKHQEIHNFLTDIAGDKVQKKMDGYIPHVSILTVPKSEAKEVTALLPEMKKLIRKYGVGFKPDQIQIWDKDFKVSEIEDNVFK